MSSNVFVFVVCGSKEHLDTLHFSLTYLKHYSKNDIVVITDKSRNEIAINHDNIIDVKTPETYNHHQASIYLKTGIHKFLPKGKLYCYLDTDVVAINQECDKIFDHYIPPIRFAADHCKLRSFSPYAVYCDCLERCSEDRKNFMQSLKKHDKNQELNSSFAKQQRKKIEEKYHQIQNSFLSKIFYAFRYYLSYPKFWLNREIYYDKRKRLWASNKGEVIKYELDIKSIARETNLKYTLWYNRWKNRKGEDIFDLECDHLAEQIQETFGISVGNKNFQHWNGGVFLFNDQSHEFLNSWHEKSVFIFNKERWRTRDQGTLIATVWEYGLENHPTLSKDWNFIADFHNNKLAVSKESDTLTDDLFETTYKPALVHIFHEWGNQKWDLWNWVLEKHPERKKLYSKEKVN